MKIPLKSKAFNRNSQPNFHHRFAVILRNLLSNDASLCADGFKEISLLKKKIASDGTIKSFYFRHGKKKKLFRVLRKSKFRARTSESILISVETFVLVN